MYILSFTSLFLLVAIYASEIQYLPINHTHSLDLVNMFLIDGSGGKTVTRAS
jgi:hypothetical protein